MSALPPECQENLIAGYVLGNLSPAEASLVTEMLAENPSLNQRVIEMQSTLDLAYQPPEVTPPTQLRDRILAIAQTEAVSTSDTTDLAPTKSVTPWNKIWGAIAIAMIGILGLVNYRLWQSVRTANNQEQIRATEEQLTYLLQDQEGERDSRGKLVVEPDQLKATLEVDNLPPLPPDRVYALWTVVGQDVPYTTDTKGAILTAVFQVNQTGAFSQEIAVPQPYLEPKIINKVAITIEDRSAPQAHQGSIFISTGN